MFHALVVALTVGSTLGVAAQPVGEGKTVVAEPVAVFNQWVGQQIVTVPEVTAIAGTPPQVFSWTTSDNLTRTAFQTRPLIVGRPDLPLVGDSALRASRPWNAQLNYQGVHVSLLVLDASGGSRQVRPINAALQPGERFKLRVVASFDSLLSVDRLLGGAWSAERVGQFYPSAGMSVQLAAGQTADLPLGPNEYFVAPLQAQDRMLLTVRHPQAVGTGASDQPVYRQDSGGGSSYLQLVPPGKFAVVEQIVQSRFANQTQ
jgi:hypothetical protein